MSGWTERVFNTTPFLGLFDQYAWRLAKGRFSDFNPLSDDFDPALIPFNFGASQDRAVTGEDFGADNGWERFLLETALSPTTYMTAAFTAPAKFAQAIGRASKIKGLSGAAKQGRNLQESLSLMRSAAGKLNGSAADDAMALLGKADELGEGLDFLDRARMSDLGQMALEKELMFGVPFGLANMGFGIRVPTAHKSWLGLVSDPVGKGVGMAYGAISARNSPLLKPLQGVIAPFAAFAEGARGGTLGRVAFDLAGGQTDQGRKALADSLDSVSRRGVTMDGLRDRFGPGMEGYSSRLDQARASGQTPEEFVRSTLLRDKGATDDAVRAHWGTIQDQLGVDQQALSFDSLETLVDDANLADLADRNRIGESMIERSPRNASALRKTNRLAFESGEKLARGFHRLFVGDTGFAALDEQDKLYRRAAVDSTRELEAIAELSEGMFTRVADSLNMDPQDVRQSFGIMMEAVPSADEAAYWRRSLKPAWEDAGDKLVRAAAAEAKGFAAEGKRLRSAARKDLAGVKSAFEGHMNEWLFGRLGDAAAALSGANGPLGQMMRRGLAKAGVPTDLVGAAEKGVDDIAEIMRSRTVRESDSPFARLVRVREQALRYVDSIGDEDIFEAPLGLIDEMENALVRFSDSVMEPFLESAKENGSFDGINDLLGALGDLRREHLNLSSQYAFTGRSIPLAYVPRVLGRQETQRVREILGPLADDQKVAAAVFSPRAAELRDADHLTTPTLNAIIDDLRTFDTTQGGGTLAGQVLDDLAEAVPEVKQRFSGDPVSSFVTSISSMREFDSIENFVDGLATRAMTSSERLPFTVGRIVGFYSGGRVRGGLEAGRIDAKILNDGRVQSQLRGQMEGLPEKWVVLERPDGRQVPIPLSGSQNEMVLAVAGEGDSAGRAASRMLAKGDKLPRLGSGTTDDALSALQGQHVMAGSADVVNGLTESIGKRFDDAPSDLRMMFDQIHGLQRASVTVVRPSFHLWNLLSAGPMLSMQGATKGAIVGGFADAFMMFRDLRKADFAGKYARQIAWEGSGQGWVPKALRGFDVTRMARLGRKLGDQEMAYRLAGTSEELGLGDMLEGFRRGGLFNTFGVEGLRGITRETKQLESIRKNVDLLYEAMDEAKKSGSAIGLTGTIKAASRRGGATGALMTALSRVGESSEILARVAGAMSFMRMGMDPEAAARAAGTALVDYADVTRSFKRYVKLGTSFPTFMTKMLPQSFRAFARDPSSLAVAARGLYNAPFTSADRGRVDAHIGEYKIGLQRALPHLDLISAGAFYSDALFNWDGFKTTPQDIGEDPFPLAMPLQAVQDFMFSEEPGRMARGFRNVLRSSYVTRWTLADQSDPLRPQGTLFDASLREFLGVTKEGETIRRRWLAGQYERLANEATFRMSQDPENADYWSRELRQLSNTTKALLSAK